jgi:LysR family transcriptional regulator for bpeEF and oprC
MDRLEAMRVFVRVAESGSFSAVARTLGLGQPAVSKQIAALEDHLGAQLIRRGPRGISLTEAGREFYDSATRLLGELELAEARVGRGQASPSGLLRVALSAGFGRMHVVPLLPEFLKRYPDITVDFRVSDRYVDPIEEGIDMAIRIGDLADSSLVARRIASTPLIVVASPAYLRAHGEPRTPADLAGRDGVTFSAQGAPVTWHFAGPEGRSSVQPRLLMRTNDAELARAAVLADLGIAFAPLWLFAGDLRARALKQILKPYVSKPYPISSVYPGGRKPPRKVTAFINFLAEAFARNPDWAGRSR